MTTQLIDKPRPSMLPTSPFLKTRTLLTQDNRERRLTPPKHLPLLKQAVADLAKYDRLSLTKNQCVYTTKDQVIVAFDYRRENTARGRFFQVHYDLLYRYLIKDPLAKVNDKRLARCWSNFIIYTPAEFISFAVNNKHDQRNQLYADFNNPNDHIEQTTLFNQRLLSKRLATMPQYEKAFSTFK